MSKLRYLVKKLGILLLTLYTIATFNFFLFRILPGDPLRLIARSGHMSGETIARLQVLFGLDKPLWMQYFIYLKNIVTGEFGISITYRRDVIEIISERLFNSVVLLAAATLIVITLGIGTGIIAAMKRGTKTDRTLVVASMIGWSLPTFWTGLLLIIVFGVFVKAFPIAGVLTPGMVYATRWDLIADYARHLVLPTIALVVVDMAEFFLITRSALVDVLTEDYILTAKGKGLGPNMILWRHALHNAMLPIVTTLALYVSLVIGGTIQVETVFSYPGIGKLVYDAVLRRDYPLLETCFLFLASLTVIASFVADILYMVIDPRVKNL